MNRQVYMETLGNFLFPELEKSDLTKSIVFLQDGTLPLFPRHAVEVLRAAFHGRWIGKGGSVLLPYKNPDLAPLDFFFFFGIYLKNYLCMDKIEDLNHMKTSIRKATQRVRIVRMVRSGN
jgi:hypothetical protein